MSAEVLRRAADALRASRPSAICDCGDTDHWFDRSICPDPCGSMHDICVDCGRIKGRCAVAADARKPSLFNLAVADLLTEMVDHAEVEPGDGTCNAAALTVARAYLGESA